METLKTKKQKLLIGISGKKQSGKSSLCDFLKVWHKVVYYYKLPYTIFQGPTGNIELYRYEDDISGEKSFSTEEVYSSIANKDDSVKVYNFADTLKELCNKVLGLSKNQCYGTDTDKNSLTQYVWDNFPPSIREDYSKHTEEIHTGSIGHDAEGNILKEIQRIKVPRSGLMTAREIMQVVGTDVFRRMFNDKVWVNATFNKIKEEDKDIALIADTRFESELNAIIDNGGYLIRLNRVVDKTDIHPSETALDNYDFESLGDRCIVLNNDTLEINEKNLLATEWIEHILNTRS